MTKPELVIVGTLERQTKVVFVSFILILSSLNADNHDSDSLTLKINVGATRGPS